MAVPVVHDADNQVGAATTADAVSVDRPTNVAAGDLILIYWVTRNKNTAPVAEPAGFTLLHRFNSSSTTLNPTLASHPDKSP